MELLTSVAKALSKPDTILFIGSGISCWSGIPKWKELISSLLQYCESLGNNVEDAKVAIEKEDYTYAAGILSELITKAQMGDFFRTQNSFFDAVPHGIHKKILAFGLKCYITTNYDTLIEDAFNLDSPESAPEIITNENSEMLERIQKPDALEFIYKFHGDINTPENIVITYQDYGNLMHNSDVVTTTLYSLMSKRSIVMLGVGLKDPDVALVLEKIKAKGGENISEIYALNSDMTEYHRRYHRNTKGIEILNYKVIDKDNHENLLSLLDRLYEKASDMQEASRAITDVSELEHAAYITLTPADVADRLDHITDADAELRRMILSVIYWIGPTTSKNLLDNISILNGSIEEAAVASNLAWLVEENILKASSTLILPIDRNLIDTVGKDRIDDAETLLEGVGNG